MAICMSGSRAARRDDRGGKLWADFSIQVMADLSALSAKIRMSIRRGLSHISIDGSINRRDMYV